MSAALDIQEALYTALSAPGAVDAEVFNGVAPEGAAMPYVVVSEMTESPTFGTLGRGGHDGTVTLHVYAADPSNATVLALYNDCAAVLDGARLTLAGNRMVSGTLGIVTALPDPDSGGRHLVARYAALTLAGAA